jgi:hypothetical protein
MARLYDWRVYVAPGADPGADPSTWVWEDVTSLVRLESGITITRGRADEFSVAGPQRAALTVDNRDGRWVIRNPLGVWYGQIRRNMPLQVRLQRGATEYIRFTGLVDSLPSRRNTAGTNRYVPVTASGITRRLARPSVMARSALYREIMANDPTAYWPLEDGADSTEAASPVDGISPMRPFSYSRFTVPGSGGVPEPAAGLPKFATGNGIPGSGPVIDLAQGGTLHGTVPPAASGAWRIEFTMTAPRDKAASRIPIEWRTDGTWIQWQIQIQSTGILASFGDPVTGVSAGGTSATFSVFDGLPHHYEVDATQSAGVADARIYVDGTLVAVYTANTPPMTGTPGRITEVIVNPLETLNGDASMPIIGHVAVWDHIPSTNTTRAAVGWLGETPAERTVRVCAEDGVPLSVAGLTGDAMGAQPLAAILPVLRDAEATDPGVLYERTSGELYYLNRDSRYNQAVALALDYAQRHIAPPFEPVDDDQQLRNDITATRPGGRPVQYVDADSVAAEGRYGEQITVNVQSDEALFNHAAWRVHLAVPPGRDRYLLSRHEAGHAVVAVALGVDVGGIALDAGRDSQGRTVAATWVRHAGDPFTDAVIAMAGGEATVWGMRGGPDCSHDLRAAAALVGQDGVPRASDEARRLLDENKAAFVAVAEALDREGALSAERIVELFGCVGQS